MVTVYKEKRIDIHKQHALLQAFCILVFLMRRFFSFSEESLGFLQVSWMPLEIHLGSGHSLLAYFRADLDSKD